MADAVDSTELGKLLRLVAHDLRNPLSALDSNVSFLESELGELCEPARESLEDLKFSCDGMARIIDSVDVLGRFLQGKAEEEKVAVPVLTLLAEALELSLPAARSHSVELALDAESHDSDACVVVGREMFVRALRFVLHNAIQHAPAGDRIVLSLDLSSDTVRARVRDGGVPLEPELLTDAFTAVGQLRAKRSRGGRYSGGLGLFCAWICADAAGAALKALPEQSGNVFELVAKRLIG